MSLLPEGTTSEPESHNRNRKDPTEQQVKQKIRRNAKALDKLLTAFILSDEYNKMSYAKKGILCRELVYLVLDEFIGLHFDRHQIQFALQGYAAEITKQLAERAPKEEYHIVLKEKIE